MKKLILMLLIAGNGNAILFSHDDTTEESETKTEATQESEVKETADLPKTSTKSASHSLCRSERKLFINGQDSPISIIVTDKNNKQHYYTIPAGVKKTVDHVPLHIKKIVGKGNYQYKDLPISGTALNTYSVFIFTIDNTLEQLHFIDIKQKSRALNRAKNALREAQLSFKRDKKLIEKLAKKVEDIELQTIYLQ